MKEILAITQQWIISFFRNDIIITIQYCNFVINYNNNGWYLPVKRAKIRNFMKYFLTLPRKQELTFPANCLQRMRQFAWNIRRCFSGNKKKKISSICHLLCFPRVVNGHSYTVRQPLTQVLLNPDMSCLCKLCRSRSVGFFRSQLIWICTVYHKVFEFIATIQIK